MKIITWHTGQVHVPNSHNHGVRSCWSHLSAANNRLFLPARYQVVQTPAVHCHCDVCSAAGGHSAGCRTSTVCLQHHATVVTSNGVTVCGNKFPPTVSKHCQHQHSAIHKTIQAIWNTKNPSSYDIQGTASSVQYHGSLRSYPQQSSVWYLSSPANVQQS